jgi:hypothetical protein
MVGQFLNFLLETHKRQPHPLDFLVGKAATFHAPYRLALEKLSHELDEREDELGETLLDTFRIHINAFGEQPAKLLNLTPQRCNLVTHSLMALRPVKVRLAAFGSPGQAVLAVSPVSPASTKL